MGIFRYLNPLRDGIDYFICLGCKHANEYHTEIRLGFRFAINVLKVIKFENLTILFKFKLINEKNLLWGLIK